MNSLFQKESWNDVVTESDIMSSSHTWEHHESIGHGFKPCCFLDEMIPMLNLQNFDLNASAGASKMLPPFRLLIYWTRQDITSSHSESLSSTTPLMLSKLVRPPRIYGLVFASFPKMLKWLFFSFLGRFFSLLLECFHGCDFATPQQEACSKIRVQLSSQPEQIDQLERRRQYLEVGGVQLMGGSTMARHHLAGL